MRINLKTINHQETKAKLAYKIVFRYVDPVFFERSFS